MDAVKTLKQRCMRTERIFTVCLSHNVFFSEFEETNKPESKNNVNVHQALDVELTFSKRMLIAPRKRKR